MYARVPTGVYGLDELVEGGFPQGRTILVSGACGTGKSIFSMQFLYRGAVERQEPGVFVTFDESPENIRSDMLRFGWNLEELERHNLLAIVDGASARAGAPSAEEHSLNPSELDVNRVLTEILTVARRIGAKRLVLDSIAALAFYLPSHHELRKSVLRICQTLSRTGLTSVVTTELYEQPVKEGELHFSKYGVEEYVVDGVVLLNIAGTGAQAERTLYVRKMRGTKHSLETHPFEITEKGIVVRKKGALG